MHPRSETTCLYIRFQKEVYGPKLLSVLERRSARLGGRRNGPPLKRQIFRIDAHVSKKYRTRGGYCFSPQGLLRRAWPGAQTLLAGRIEPGIGLAGDREGNSFIERDTVQSLDM